MKRVTVQVNDLDKDIKPVEAPNFKTGTIHHFFVEKFDLKAFMNFMKESRNEKTK